MPTYSKQAAKAISKISNPFKQKIKEAIENLPTLQREAIFLKYYNDLKIKEISNITGDNENTIKSRLFNGIKNLKKLLGGGIFEEESQHIQTKM